MSLMTSFEGMVSISLAWIFFFYVFEGSGTVWLTCEPLAHYCNAFYSVINSLSLLIILYLLLPTFFFNKISLDWFFCGSFPIGNNAVTWILLIYYYSKIYEFMDVILCLLRNIPIHPHFRIHHSTTLSLAWTILYSRSIHGVTFMISNILMHAVLYYYLAGDTGKNTVALHFIRVWGHVQLIVGIVGSLGGFMHHHGLKRFGNLSQTTECAGTSFTELYSLVLYLTYFALLQYEIHGDWQPSKKKKLA